MKKRFQNLVKKIEADNEKFEKLSDEKKRIVVIKDCIARIKAEQIIVSCGITVKPTVGKELVDREDSIQDIINNQAIPCKACAKGGLFLAYVGRVNKMKGSDFTGGYDSIESGLHVKLLEIFPSRQISAIEYAFEGVQYLMYDENKVSILFNKEEKSNIRSYQNIPHSEERLLAIFANMLENKGTFTF